MTDYPLRVKIVASLAIVLAYACLPLFGLIYAAAYWADRLTIPTNKSIRSVP